MVMQLGGSNPEMLRRAAVHAIARGYDEINLNCGCPAQKRGKSRNNYGARLMFDPTLVAACCNAIREAAAGTNVAVTVKCRLGVDERDFTSSRRNLWRRYRCRHRAFHSARPEGACRGVACSQPTIPRSTVILQLPRLAAGSSCTSTLSFLVHAAPR